MKALANAVCLAILASAPLPTLSQSPPAPQAAVDAPIYDLVLTKRSTSAVNYRERDSTKIDFRGTPLLPDARGVATVKSDRGRTGVEAKFEKLEAATKFGPEYLTYVLWAVTPAGRATSLGELVLDKDEARLDATTDLQTFAMIVTAEPYFAVTQPSDVVVIENIVRPGTAGKIEQVDAKYELLPRGQYTLNVGSDAFERRVFDRRVPFALYQAQNAVLISRFAGAEKYASDNYQKAARLLQQAENAQAKKASQKDVAVLARQAVQAAEDARLITIKRKSEEALAQERRAAADSAQKAKADAEAAARRAEVEAAQRAEAQRSAQLESERQAIERERLDAERAKLAAETAAQRAARERAEADAARSALADAERQRLMQERQAATERDSRARLEQEAEARRRTEAEAMARTERLRRESEQRQQTEMDSQRVAREKADAEARRGVEAEHTAHVEADRQREAERVRLETELNTQRAAREKAEAEARQVAEAARTKQEAETAAQQAARQKADAEARQVAEAERAKQVQAERQQLDEARANAERAKLESETAAQQAARQKAEVEEARAKLVAERQAEAERQTREKAEAERLKFEQARLEAERGRLQAETAAQQAQREKTEAEAARAAAQLEAEAARQAAAEAQRQQTEAEQKHAETRAELQQRLNAILETRATERGLVVNMADLVFGSGQSTLLGGAREKLAKIAGLLLTHPELQLAVEGHTDGVGSDVTNQQLSERRANAVREFLIQQGIPGQSIAAQGFGESQPLTSNDTPEGRQQNRRVEIVVSGGTLGRDG